MTKRAKLVVGLMAMVVTLHGAALCEERAAPRDATPYTGPKRPFDPKPLMDKLRADPSQQTGPFTFVCVSDREFGLKEFNEVARQAEKTGFDFCVLPGDMVHRGAGPQGIQDYDDLERESGWFLARHPCWPVLGNHEIGKNSGSKDRRPDADGFERWKAFYNMPDDWYSFTYRNNLFIVIGSISDLTAERQRDRVEVYPGKHLAWLEQQLKAGQGMDNIFVFQHLPLFSVGIHEDNPRHPMVDLCAKYNVTAVICGHDHNYYRTFRKGVSYLLCAGGGGSLYDLTHTGRALPSDVYLGRVKIDENRSGGYRLHHPAQGADQMYKTAPYFFLALTIDGKKVTARAVITGGEEIDRAVLRDAQGRNLAPEIGKAITPVSAGQR
jgi:hypothetical protein